MNRVEYRNAARAVLSGLLYLAFTTSVLAQASLATGPSVAVTRIDRAPVIDGRLDEPEWQQAGVIRDLVQIRPGDGVPMSEKTEIYLMYDKDALYVAARMWDPGAPDEVTANIMKQNTVLGNDDRIAIIIDPFNTGRNGYRFEVNANGVRNDMLYQNGQLQPEWTVIWDAAATIGRRPMDRGVCDSLQIAAVRSGHSRLGHQPVARHPASWRRSCLGLAQPFDQPEYRGPGDGLQGSRSGTGSRCGARRLGHTP